MKHPFRKTAACLAALTAAAFTASAQYSADSGIQAINSQLSSVRSTVMTTVYYLMGLVMVGGAVLVIAQYIKGEHDAAQKSVHWVVGLLFALIAIAVVNAVFFK